jgi:predicted methyltransferase
MTHGHYYATAADLDNPKLSDSQRQGRERFAAFYASRPELYGKITLLNFSDVSMPLPAKTFDFVHTARSIRNWMSAGTTEKMFKDIYESLKVGGILAVEQHRASPGNRTDRTCSLDRRRNCADKRRNPQAICSRSFIDLVNVSCERRSVYRGGIKWTK